MDDNNQNDNDDDNKNDEDDIVKDFDFEKMAKLFWLIYNSKETLWGEFKNPKFITENPQIINYLVKSLNNELDADEIIEFINHQWAHLTCTPSLWNIPSIPTNSNIDSLKEENQNLKEENQNLKQRLKQYEPSNLYCLSIDQLNSLSMTFINKISKIDQVMQEIYDRKIKCIICRAIDKDIIIQDCGHFILCVNCESKLSPKICPQCQRSYTNTFKIRL